jgi:hypothetical protein
MRNNTSHIPKEIAEAPHIFYQNDLALRNTADMTGDKSIAV